MKVKFLMLLILTLIAVPSCIDEYWPDLGKYENLLVVDGTVTQEPGPYTVRLSLTSDVENPAFIPYSGCRVVIQDNVGNTEQLAEKEPGMYVTSPEGIQGIVGRKYKLTIYSPEGKSYESPFEELLAPVGIDTVYAEVEYIQTADLNHDLVGYQFYVDTYRAENDTNYYLWQLEETYEFHADFFIDYTYSGKIVQFTNRDSVHTCWRTENVYEIFTANTLDLTQPLITRFPLHYVDTETRRIYIRYSLLTRQFTTSAAAFTFWDDIRNLITNEGSLYTKQPYQITGNVSNINDPDEPVLGYFLVAGVDEKRMYVHRPASVPFYYPVCELITDLRGLFMSAKNQWPIYLEQTSDGRLGYGSDECFDCTLNNGTLEKPDFWID